MKLDHDTIIRLAEEAGLEPRLWNHTDAFERFAALVAKAERDRICEMLRQRHKQEERHNYYGFIANMIEEMK